MLTLQRSWLGLASVGKNLYFLLDARCCVVRAWGTLHDLAPHGLLVFGRSLLELPNTCFLLLELLLQG